MHIGGWLALALLVSVAAGVASAQEIPPEQPLAILQVTVEPSEARLAGGGTLELKVVLSGFIRCIAGLTAIQPPEPVRGILVAAQGPVDRLQLRFEPATFEVPWTAAGQSEFRIDENVTVQVHVGAAPGTREDTDFSVLIEPRTTQETRPRCSPQGYSVDEQERSVHLIVQPEEEEPFLAPVGGRLNWAPLVLAFALLGVVAVFAVNRERGRRGGSS